MIYTIYNTTTGQIAAVRSGTTNFLQIPQGYASIPGRYDALKQYIDAQGQPQDLPDMPRDDQTYRFDWTTRTWQVVPAEAAKPAWL